MDHKNLLFFRGWQKQCMKQVGNKKEEKKNAMAVWARQGAADRFKTGLELAKQTKLTTDWGF